MNKNQEKVNSTNKDIDSQSRKLQNLLDELADGTRSLKNSTGGLSKDFDYSVRSASGFQNSASNITKEVSSLTSRVNSLCSAAESLKSEARSITVVKKVECNKKHAEDIPGGFGGNPYGG